MKQKMISSDPETIAKLKVMAGGLPLSQFLRELSQGYDRHQVLQEQINDLHQQLRELTSYVMPKTERKSVDPRELSPSVLLSKPDGSPPVFKTNKQGDSFLIGRQKDIKKKPDKQK